MKNKAISLAIVALIMLNMITGGCADSTSSTTPADQIVFIISFDDNPDGYSEGEQIYGYFMYENRFRVQDRSGFLDGDYKWNSDNNELTLDYDNNSKWRILLDDNGNFGGKKNGYSNGGTYEWGNNPSPTPPIDSPPGNIDMKPPFSS